MPGSQRRSATDKDAAAAEPEVTKREVTMTNYVAGADGEPVAIVQKDYVRPDFLDAYVADARTKYQRVEVSETPDAGPGGYHGATYVPEHLDHPLAGQLFPATTPED